MIIGMDSIAAVVTTLSAVNSAIASVKNARDMAKDSQDANLKNAVSEALDAVLDLKNPRYGTGRREPPVTRQVEAESKHLV